MALILLLATLAYAQDSQFFFDPNGNLFVQAAATTAPPQIIGQPQNRMVAPGDSASIFVVAADTRALTYQWRFNGVPIGGSATNDALLLLNVSTNNEGEYRVVLSNPSGSVTSAPASLIIDSDADGVADSWETAFFGSLTNSATTDFDGDGSSNLQEFLKGTNPADSNSVRFVVTVVRDGGSVIKVPDQSSYTNGETVTLTAISSTDAPFHAWFGDILTRSNPVTLVMTNNKTLYARFTPIVFFWTNVAGGDWNVAENWRPNLAPGSNDSVVIPNNATVTLNTSADCADVTLGSAGSTPTLTGSGTLTVRGSFVWTSGTMSGSGRTVLAAGATLNVANPAMVSVQTRTLENGGTMLWTGAGNLNLLTGAVITNRAGALFQVQSPASFTANGFENGRIDNAGTFRKSVQAGPTTTGGGISFNNSGTVEIQTGTLELTGGGTHSGSFNVPAGTALRLSGGTHNANVSSSITGAGQFTQSGGTLNLAGLVNISGSNTFSGGIANLTGNYICTNNTLTISGSAANFSGTGLVSPAVLSLSGGTLGGTSVVTVNNVMNWSGGTMSGTGRTIIPAGVTLNVSNPGTLQLTTRTLENGGTILWTGAGNLNLLTGAVITNRAGALFHVQSPASFTANGFENGRIDNAGTFRKSVQAGPTTTGGGIGFNNAGTVDIQTGTLELTGGGTHSGSFTVPAGTAFRFSGDHNAAGSSSITGAGQFTQSGGTVNLAGLVNVSGSNTFSGGIANLTGNYICTNNTLTLSGSAANFSGTGLVSPAMVNLSNGTLGGTGTVTVNSVMNWTGGTMTGSGRTIIPAGATLNVANPAQVFVQTRTLENGGTMLWTGAGTLGLSSGAVITNRAGALFHVQSPASFTLNGFENGRIDNAGTFRKSAQAGTTTTGGGISFNNSGTVDIRSGILAATGGYVSSANALLNCALGGTTPGTGYGRLQVAGTVTLNGALSVNLINGFVPATNDTFTVLTAGTRNGTFINFSFPSNMVTMQLSNTANSVIVRVTDVLTATPRPALLPAELIGSNIKLTWTAVSNVSYRLEFNPDQTNFTNWNALSGDVTAVTNTASKLDALTPSNRLYRVRVLP